MQILFGTLASKISSALLGIVFGVLTNYSILSGSWMNLGVWAVIGLLIGLFIEDKKFVMWSGLYYGFFVTISFLISGFEGTSDKLIGFIFLSLVLGLIGALCGWCLVFVSNWVKRKFRNNLEHRHGRM